MRQIELAHLSKPGYKLIVNFVNCPEFVILIGRDFISVSSLSQMCRHTANFSHCYRLQVTSLLHSVIDSESGPFGIDKTAPMNSLTLITVNTIYGTKLGRMPDMIWTIL